MVRLQISSATVENELLGQAIDYAIFLPPTRDGSEENVSIPPPINTDYVDGGSFPAALPNSASKEPSVPVEYND